MTGLTTGTGRLLPWTTPEGNPCYVAGNGTGYVSRVADKVERVQLGMALDLLDHAAGILGDRRATPEQLRYLAARMAETLLDVHRIAESRGARMAEPAGADSDESAAE